MSKQPAVVLIHGLSETREVWWRQKSFLEPAMCVVSYDVRGFGASPTGAADGTVHQMADDLAQLLSAFETGPAWLVGFSMGGVIAQRFALNFPELTKGLVLVASSCAVGRGGKKFFNHRDSRALPKRMTVTRADVSIQETMSSSTSTKNCG
jgi:3-oxoadipate enol-lactonase